MASVQAYKRWQNSFFYMNCPFKNEDDYELKT